MCCDNSKYYVCCRNSHLEHFPPPTVALGPKTAPVMRELLVLRYARARLADTDSPQSSAEKTSDAKRVGQIPPSRHPPPLKRPDPARHCRPGGRPRRPPLHRI